MSDAQILSVLSTLAARLEDVTGRLEKLEVSGGSGGGGGGSSGGGGGIHASVAGWRAIMSNEVATWVSAANAVGGKVAEAAAVAQTAFDAVSVLIEKASVCSKPGDLQAELGDISNALGAVSGIDKGRDRKDPVFMMLDFLASGIQSLTFVAYDQSAWQAIEQNVEVMRFIGDKILMGYRKTGPITYITYENSFSAIWKAMTQYVKDFHPAGLAWQQGGIPTSDYTPGMIGAGSAPAAPVGGSSAAASSSTAAPASSSDAGAAWALLCSENLTPFLATCEQVGGPVAQQGPLLKEAHDIVSNLIAMSAACKKPAGDAFREIFAPLSEAIQAIDKVRLPKARDDPVEWLQKCLNGGINALTFVCTPERAWEAVDSNRDGMQFFGDKIYMRNRKTGPQLYVDFVDQFKKLLIDMSKFVKDYCPCGLAWNATGGDAASFTGGAAPAAAPAPAEAAPSGGKGSGGKGGKGKGPPRGGPSTGFSEAKRKELADRAAKTAAWAAEQAAQGAMDPRQAMLAELKNKTKDGGLKDGFVHIDKKDRNKPKGEKIIRKKPAAPRKKWDSGPKVRRPEENGRVGFDKIKLANVYGEMSKKENRTIVVEHEKRDAVDIQDCEYCNIEIQGMPKVLNITGCKKFYVTIPGALASINVDNSSSGYARITGVARTMQVDKTDGFDVTLEEPAYNCKFVSSKASGFNLAIEKEGEEGTDCISMAVPVQYATTLVWDGDKPHLRTVPNAGCGM
jgi:adenylyl cyclase-associated protein